MLPGGGAGGSGEGPIPQNLLSTLQFSPLPSPKNSPTLSSSNLVSNIVRVVRSLGGCFGMQGGFPQVRRPRPLPLTEAASIPKVKKSQTKR